MIKINEYFDKVFLITCYHTKDRLSHVVPYLNSRGIHPEIFFAPFKERFHYSYYNKQPIWPGAHSLSCAYEQLFQKCLYDKDVKSALFIEDDIILADDWDVQLKNIWFEQDKDWYILKESNGTHFFAMSREAIADFLNKYAADTYPIDLAINDLQDQKITNKLNIRNQPSLFTTQSTGGYNHITGKEFLDEEKIPSTVEIPKRLRQDLVFHA
tara:strand:+ start:5964 stop:6599 length:636 start_codon:yes stop_codon:yes gene_type:complete